MAIADSCDDAPLQRRRAPSVGRNSGGRPERSQLTPRGAIGQCAGISGQYATPGSYPIASSERRGFRRTGARSHVETLRGSDGDSCWRWRGLWRRRRESFQRLKSGVLSSGARMGLRPGTLPTIGSVRRALFDSAANSGQREASGRGASGQSPDRARSPSRRCGRSCTEIRLAPRWRQRRCD